MNASWEAFLQSLEGGWGYVFLFFSSLGENLFPPLPGDTVTVGGAMLVGMQQLKLVPVYLSTTAGSFLGFMILYSVGRRWGSSVMMRLPFFNEDQLSRVEAWFSRYGIWVIGANRFLSGFRGIVSLAAGMVKMDQRLVTGLALLSCLLWNALLMVLGIWVGVHWETILRNYQRVILILMVAGGMIFWIRRRLKKGNQKP